MASESMRMMEPLPNCFSICASAAASAFDLLSSITFPGFLPPSITAYSGIRILRIENFQNATVPRALAHSVSQPFAHNPRAGSVDRRPRVAEAGDLQVDASHCCNTFQVRIARCEHEGHVLLAAKCGNDEAQVASRD